MAFWGVEVRPGKPFTHSFEQSRGRLRITQATLGDGTSSGKSTMQCNVGSKSPVLLCNLLPKLSETCHLELEFEENEKVIFSVLGQRSIHLAGYFLSSVHSLGGGDSDSYGEDIAESDTSESYSHETEDEYESDFIDDGDVEIFSDFPMRKSSVVIEEIEEDKLPDGNRKLLRLRKKHQVSDTEVAETEFKQLVVDNTGSDKVMSEDEDGFPISTIGSRSSKTKKRNGDKKRKIDAFIQDNVPLSTEATENHGYLVPSEAATNVDKKSKKKKKEKEEKHPIVSEIDATPKDQKDDTNNMGNRSESEVKVSTVDVEEQILKDQKDSKLKSKKNKKKDIAKEGTSDEKEQEEKHFIVSEIDDKPKDQKDDANNMGSKSENDKVSTVDIEEQTFKDQKDNKLKSKKNKKDIAEEGTLNEKDSIKLDNFTEVPNEDDMPFDGSNVDASPATIDASAGKKKKKNKKKKCDSDIKDVAIAEGKTELQDSLDDSMHEPKAYKTRSFPNGLVVEEVSMGKPDGKRASPGKKVSVHYIGKLKNGSIFDSSFGKKPFKFRLGIGEVIKGWDTGINGMRVGDKRRLIIPPSFAYGEKGVGKIPPNSWLTFDVELVDVQ